MAMRILFINKYDIAGGAAIAAWRLHEELERSGNTEHVFLVGIKRSDAPIVRTTRKPGFENFLERGSSFVLNLLGLQYVWFPFSTRRIRRLAGLLKPDIISLHNIHGGFFSLTLLRDLSRTTPVVWTLHDMWAFTASAAHTFGDESWKEMRPGPGEHRLFPATGLPTGRWLFRRKKRVYADSRLTIVTPSRWLYNLARESPLFEHKNIVQIYNGIDLDKFVPGDRAEAKRSLGIDPGMKVVSFSAEKLMDSEHKGGKTLLSVLEALDRSREPICLLTMGGGHLPDHFHSLTIREMGYVTEESEFIRCLQASDVYMHPTKADTLPNVLIEAIACGTPGVAFDVGGCGEIIFDDVNGFLIPCFDFGYFAERVQQILRGEALAARFSKNARAIAERTFDVRKMASQYDALFQELS